MCQVHCRRTITIGSNKMDNTRTNGQVEKYEKVEDGWGYELKLTEKGYRGPGNRVLAESKQP